MSARTVGWVRDWLKRRQEWVVLKEAGGKAPALLLKNQPGAGCIP